MPLGSKKPIQANNLTLKLKNIKYLTNLGTTSYHTKIISIYQIN